MEKTLLVLMKQNNILPNEGAIGVDLTEILNLTYTRY